MIQQEMLQYQQIDGELNRIERDLKKSDAYKKSRQYKALRADYEDKLTKLDAKAGELKNQLASAKQALAKITVAIEEYSKEILDVEHKDELNYMNKKLDEQMKLLANVEKEIRKILQSGEELSKMFEEINAKLPKIIQAYNAARKEFEEATEKVKPRVKELRAKLEELSKVIDPKWFDIYKKISAGQTFPVFVPLRDGVRCGGCQMEMPTAVVETQMKDKGYMRCESCGRIIYKQ